jgi:mannose-6-phosphate isomerase-like protein (cupin superfamily)
MIEYTHHKKQYLFATNVSWLDVASQIELEKVNDTYRAISDETDLCIDCGCVPGFLANIYQKFKRDYGYNAMHMYTSRKIGAETLGRHNDDQDVLIVQSRGRMTYKFDDDNVVTLYPGDGLYIPAWVHHNPITIEPRITLSLSRG